MAVTVLWPEDRLPLPSKQGYVLKWKSSLLRTDFERGAARHRRQGAAKPLDLPVVWDLTQWELMLFHGFYEHEAGEGTTWFGIPLLTYVGIATCEARFKGDPSAPKQLGDLWQVTANLEVREIPRLSSAGYDVLVNENPDTFGAAIDAFHALIATPPLWASGDDLYLHHVYGEDTAYLFAEVAAFHAAMASTELWPD